MSAHWAPCEALTEMPPDRPEQDLLYRTWNEVKGGG
jgi:phenylacetic acid degradation protein/carnitine operon protein CaiE